MRWAWAVELAHLHSSHSSAHLNYSRLRLSFSYFNAELCMTVYEGVCSAMVSAWTCRSSSRRGGSSTYFYDTGWTYTGAPSARQPASRRRRCHHQQHVTINTTTLSAQFWRRLAVYDIMHLSLFSSLRLMCMLGSYDDDNYFLSFN